MHSTNIGRRARLNCVDLPDNQSSHHFRSNCTEFRYILLFSDFLKVDGRVFLHFRLRFNNLMDFRHVITQLPDLSEFLVAEDADSLVFLSLFPVVDVLDVRCDIVAVQELFVANPAL